MNTDDNELDALEGRLAGTLRRMPPPDDFVERLRGHIHVPERGELVLRVQDWLRVMLVFGGVMSGAVIALTFARALLHLLGRRSV